MDKRLPSCLGLKFALKSKFYLIIIDNIFCI
jgi:hypothetical protein